MKAKGRVKPLWALLIFALSLGLLNRINLYQQTEQHAQDSTSELTQFDGMLGSDLRFAEVFKAQQSGVQLSGEGTIKRLLPDDTRGSRHQKILVTLASGQTILLVHNIDLAPRLENLRQGELIEFAGEYEWNSQGGLIHWTHHDPQGYHSGGWIKYQGRVYK